MPGIVVIAHHVEQKVVELLVHERDEMQVVRHEIEALTDGCLADAPDIVHSPGLALECSFHSVGVDDGIEWFPIIHGHCGCLPEELSGIEIGNQGGTHVNDGLQRSLTIWIRGVVQISRAICPDALIHDDSAGGPGQELTVSEGLKEAMQPCLMEGGEIIDLLIGYSDGLAWPAPAQSMLGHSPLSSLQAPRRCPSAGR